MKWLEALAINEQDLCQLDKGASMPQSNIRRYLRHDLKRLPGLRVLPGLQKPYTSLNLRFLRKSKSFQKPWIQRYLSKLAKKYT